MERNGIAAVFFLFLILFHVSNATLFWKLRDLVDEAPNSSSAAKDAVSPSPSPEVSNATGSALPPAQNGKESGKNPEASAETDSASPPPKTPTDSGRGSNSSNSAEIGKDKHKKKGEGKENRNDNEDKNSSQPGPSETCKEVPKSKMCNDQNSLIACIKRSESGSKELVVLVENEGEEILMVHPVPSTSVVYPFKELKIPKLETKRINISLDSNQSVNLTFNAGHGDCVLHVDPLVFGKNSIVYLPSYDKLVTPINGAYFLIAAVIIFVSTWTCCKFRKRRRQLDEIPYQELEMGRPESMSAATGVETAEGWDQGWDDDWDEEQAVKSPAGRHLGNISANGLTARSSNKDGWENDWND